MKFPKRLCRFQILGRTIVIFKNTTKYRFTRIRGNLYLGPVFFLFG